MQGVQELARWTISPLHLCLRRCPRGERRTVGPREPPRQELWRLYGGSYSPTYQLPSMFYLPPENKGGFPQRNPQACLDSWSRKRSVAMEKGSSTQFRSLMCRARFPFTLLSGLSTFIRVIPMVSPSRPLTAQLRSPLGPTSLATTGPVDSPRLSLSGPTCPFPIWRRGKRETVNTHRPRRGGG